MPSKVTKNSSTDIDIYLVPGFRFQVSGFRFQVSGFRFGFQVSGLGFRFRIRVVMLSLSKHLWVPGFKFRVSGCPAEPVEASGFWVSGSGFRVSGFRFRVSGFGFRVVMLSLSKHLWVPGFRFRVPGCHAEPVEASVGFQV